MQLLIATAMVAATVLIHLAGLSILVAVMRKRSTGRTRSAAMVHQGVAIMTAAFGLFALHTVEIWAYAGLYLLLGALPDFEQALYFSTSTYVTLGYGDIVLPIQWRILGAIEGANGILLLGWSTAFFVSIINRIRLMEGGAEDS
jgi:hypothetical protein